VCDPLLSYAGAGATPAAHAQTQSYSASGSQHFAHDPDAYLLDEDDDWSLIPAKRRAFSPDEPDAGAEVGRPTRPTLATAAATEPPTTPTESINAMQVSPHSVAANLAFKSEEKTPPPEHRTMVLEHLSPVHPRTSNDTPSKSLADILDELPGLARLAQHDPHFEYRARNIDGDRVQCNGCSRWMKLTAWERHLTDGCRVYVLRPVLPVPARRLLAARTPSPQPEASSHSSRRISTSPLTPAPSTSSPSVEPPERDSELAPLKIRQTEGDRVQCDGCGKWLRKISWPSHEARNCRVVRIIF